MKEGMLLLIDGIETLEIQCMYMMTGQPDEGFHQPREAYGR